MPLVKEPLVCGLLNITITINIRINIKDDGSSHLVSGEAMAETFLLREKLPFCVQPGNVTNLYMYSTCSNLTHIHV
jgi:hypothetical protein